MTRSEPTEDGATPASGRVSGRTAVRGALITALWTLSSRILGFVRDALTASFFGVTAMTGAFALAWVVPNLFRRLLGEGAVGAAIQPALARARVEEGEEEARRLYASFHGLLLGLLVAIVVVGEAVLLGILALDGGRSDAVRFAALLLPYVLPICLAALAAAPQHLSGRYLRPALAPALLNIVWITALLGLYQAVPDLHTSRAGMLGLCGAILLGGIAQWALQLRGVRTAGFPLRPRRGGDDPRLRAALRAFAPAFLALAAVQLNFALDQVLVRLLVGDHANFYTWYANRLLQLPLALIGIAAATGTLPLFARLAAERRQAELEHAVRRTCESTLVVIVAAGAGLWVLAVPVIQVLFEHGRFVAEDTAELAKTLRAYLWCLPAAGLSGILTRARQSLGDLRGPAAIAALVVPVNLGLDLLLLPRLGVPGAGYATAAALTVQALLLLYGPGARAVGRPLLLAGLPRLVLPGAAAAGGAAGVAALLGASTGTVHGLALAIGAGALLAAGAAWKLLPEDFAALREQLRGRRSR